MLHAFLFRCLANGISKPHAAGICLFSSELLRLIMISIINMYLHVFAHAQCILCIYVYIYVHIIITIFHFFVDNALVTLL